MTDLLNSVIAFVSAHAWLAYLTLFLAALLEAVPVVGYNTYKWEFGDGATMIANPGNHAYAHPGMYYIMNTATKPGCSLITIDSITIGVTGKEEVHSLHSISVYADYNEECLVLNYKSESSANTTIYFLDAAGRVLKKEEVDPELNNMELKVRYYPQARGLYLVKIAEGSKSETHKVIY